MQRKAGCAPGDLLFSTSTRSTEMTFVDAALLFFNLKTNQMKQNLLPAAGILVSLLFVSCKREAQENKTTAQEKTTTEERQKTTLPEVITFSSLPNGKTETEYVEKGQHHKVQWQGSKMTALTIDGKQVPKENHAMHKATAEKVFQEIQADGQKMGRALTPPKAKGPEAGKEHIESINLAPVGTKDGPGQEKKDRERVEDERKVADNSEQ